eukprot:COSAG06_NODE_54514_length_294_cov_0.789744_1_plen_28_part_01
MFEMAPEPRACSMGPGETAKPRQNEPE